MQKPCGSARQAVLASSVLLAAALTGCGVGAPVASDPAQAPLGTLTGKVFGGQQPVQGAHVYVFQVGTSGYGATSTSLLTNIPGVTTADTTTIPGQTIYYVTTGPASSGGGFSVSGDYTCTAGTQIYILALGGSPDAGAHTNAGIGLMAGVGTCPAPPLTLASQVPFVNVNEVSTVATAYALAGFAVDAEHISSDSGVNGNSTGTLAVTGVTNAMANVANIINVGTGSALTATSATGSAGVVPQAAINTLADILASCVNSAGASSSTCGALFQAATSNGTNSGTMPSDTATAAINIAHFPGANVAALYGLGSSNPPFAPVLNAQPNDFALSLQFSGGGLNGPVNFAIDSAGNVWTANYGAPGKPAYSVSEFSSAGVALSGVSGYTGGGLNGPNSIAIDGSGNAWIANQSGNSISEFSSAGVPFSRSPFTGGGLNQPNSIAIDGSGNVWIANLGANDVSEFSSGGATISSSGGYVGGGLNQPYSIAVDGAGDAWVADVASNSVSEFSSAGAPFTGSPYTGGGLSLPDAIAVDAAGNAWIANNQNSTLTEFSPAGAALSGASGYTGGGLNQPNSVAIDGAGSVWVLNAHSVSRFASTGAAISGAGGYMGGGIGNANTVAIDGSGNVWISGYSASTMTELLGAGTPVITPICAGLSATPSANGTSNLGTRP